MRIVSVAALMCLLAVRSALAITVTLTETIPFFQLFYVAHPGVVILCNGPSIPMGGLTFCHDGLGTIVDPVGSVQFFPPDLVNMRTFGMFCTDGSVDGFPSQCPPVFAGDVAVDFENPPLPGLPSETPYMPGLNDPGFGFFQGLAVDYVLITNVPIPEPATALLVATGLTWFLWRQSGVRRRISKRRRA
jgi:hypothetical protein